MFGFLNRHHNPKVMLTEADVKKLKNSHGVILFFMHGCGHCIDMKDKWDAAVDECRNTGLGSSGDDFVLGAVESGNMDMFEKNGITTNVNGYPTILYIASEHDGNHEKYENPREKNNFIEWIKEKKNRKVGKMGKKMNQLNQMNQMNQIKQGKQGKQSGGGKRRSYRSKSKSQRHSKRHTRHTRRSKRTRRHHHHHHHHMKGGGCGCGSKVGPFW